MCDKESCHRAKLASGSRSQSESKNGSPLRPVRPDSRQPCTKPLCDGVRRAPEDALRLPNLAELAARHYEVPLVECSVVEGASRRSDDTRVRITETVGFL